MTMKKNFSLEMKVDGRDANLTLLSIDGDKIKVKVDDIIYDLDLVMVERGVYSILFKGKSYNVELIEGSSPKDYVINTFSGSFNVELVDAESRYKKNRNNSIEGSSDGRISSPMPGKVVKIPVKVGDKVLKDEVVVVISAMKMESDYKSPIDGVVSEIFVNEGDTVDSNQPLIFIE